MCRNVEWVFIVAYTLGRPHMHACIYVCMYEYMAVTKRTLSPPATGIHVLTCRSIAEHVLPESVHEQVDMMACQVVTTTNMECSH